jgi:hypothetical protein
VRPSSFSGDPSPRLLRTGDGRARHNPDTPSEDYGARGRASTRGGEPVPCRHTQGMECRDSELGGIDASRLATRCQCSPAEAAESTRDPQSGVAPPRAQTNRRRQVWARSLVPVAGGDGLGACAVGVGTFSRARKTYPVRAPHPSVLRQIHAPVQTQNGSRSCRRAVAGQPASAFGMSH